MIINTLIKKSVTSLIIIISSKKSLINISIEAKMKRKEKTRDDYSRIVFGCFTDRIILKPNKKKASLTFSPVLALVSM